MKFRTLRALVPAVLAGAMLAGCRADYAADIVNRTPQPIYTNLFRKGPGMPVLGATRRLGPGDRASVGPIRASKNSGAFLSVETMGNSVRPVTMDLSRGMSYLEVEQDGDHPDAPLRIVEKR